ncbi:hypothetical protein POTOM_019249 [Populus tomentosa]|uniref:NAC domain-containing protein n=1 Tax=Populus tomentosa TaxID=118781 RepID=A0A8X7ZVC6_POPTO|nr:hypothetical protein POTOM_019249 [Populus tomentosa]
MGMVFNQPQTPQTLPPGYRFTPTDQELVKFYLYPKVTNPNFTTSAPVRDCDIYACHPFQFHTHQGEDLFFFTDLKGRGSLPVCAVKLPVALRNGIEKTVSSWIMYEYSLPSHSQFLVLCRLKRNDKRKHTGGVHEATNTISQKARVGEGYHQQQITGFKAAAETESEIVYVNGVRFDNNWELFCRQLVQDFEKDQMGVSSVASTINVAAPIVSTSSCAENLQPNKVVCIDNHEEPSATPEADEFLVPALAAVGEGRFRNSCRKQIQHAWFKKMKLR